MEILIRVTGLGRIHNKSIRTSMPKKELPTIKTNDNQSINEHFKQKEGLLALLLIPERKSRPSIKFLKTPFVGFCTLIRLQKHVIDALK